MIMIIIIIMLEVRCEGRESRLEHCQYRDWLTWCGEPCDKNYSHGEDVSVQCLQEEVLSVEWVGCHMEDFMHDLDYGPDHSIGGFTTVTCAAECSDYLYMGLEDGGKCSCGNSFGTLNKYWVSHPGDLAERAYHAVSESECGQVSGLA